MKFIKAVFKNFVDPKTAINGLIGLFGHDFRCKNKHIFTSNSEFNFMELVNNLEVIMIYIFIMLNKIKMRED